MRFYVNKNAQPVITKFIVPAVLGCLMQRTEFT